MDYIPLDSRKYLELSDAPPEVKKAYEQFMEWKHELHRNDTAHIYFVNEQFDNKPQCQQIIDDYLLEIGCITGEWIFIWKCY